MNKTQSASAHPVVVSPVAVGGIGGSGTRLIATLLLDLGFDLGPDLNRPNDNLWFTLLFKRPEITELNPSDFKPWADIFVAAMTGARPLTADECLRIQELSRGYRTKHHVDWPAQRALSLITAASLPNRPRPEHWGWKEPNTHIVLPQLISAMPELRYIHVVRNGLDMAFSRNQNQLASWSEWLLGEPLASTPRHSLRYWCAAHKRVQLIGESMQERFLWLDYDQFCRAPDAGLDKFAGFIQLPIVDRPHMLNQIRPPASMGRSLRQPLDQFDDSDLDYLRQLGHLD